MGNPDLYNAVLPPLYHRVNRRPSSNTGAFPGQAHPMTPFRSTRSVDIPPVLAYAVYYSDTKSYTAAGGLVLDSWITASIRWT
jgi:hypothetical protein